MNHKNLKLIVLFIVILISNVALAQKEESKRFDLKLYYNFKYSNIEEVSTDSFYFYNSTTKNSLFGNISPSLLINKGRSLHEFEISGINFGTTDYLQTQTAISYNQQRINDGYKQNFFNLNIKYEYIFQLLGKDKNYGIMVGASAEPYIRRDIYRPRISLYYLTKQFTLGGKFYIIPRGVISLGKKFYVDLNFPIEIIDINWNRTYIDNPSLAKDLRTSNNYENDIFNKLFQFRLGLGIKL